MALNPTSPITGSAMTGFTSPTYTFSEDTTDADSRRLVFTAAGGTQVGVETHSVSSPFFLTISRPKQIKFLPRANPVSGLYPAIPVNEYRVKLCKGGTVNGSIAGAASETQVLIDTRIRVPAGLELSSNDPEEIKAAICCYAGFMYSNASGLYDLVSTGLLK